MVVSFSTTGTGIEVVGTGFSATTVSVWETLLINNLNKITINIWEQEVMRLMFKIIPATANMHSTNRYK